MSRSSFKESLGIFGIDSLSFLSDRMFTVMDQDKGNTITLYEYLDYFEVMLHGTKEEKMRQSFDLIDIRGYGKITQKDFSEVVMSFAQMWSAALGQPSKYCS